MKMPKQMPRRLMVAACAVLLPLASFADQFVVKVPESLRTSEFLSKNQSERGDAEFYASSWSPADFRPTGFSSDNPAFARRLTPQISFDYRRGVSKLSSRNVEIAWKSGISFSSLRRVREWSSYGGGFTQKQLVYFVSARVGGEVSLTRWERVEPYMGISFLPTLGTLTRSAFDEGGVHPGLPVEMILGSRFKISPGGASLKLGLVVTLGSVNSGDFGGTGIQGGIGIPMYD
ncbi:MAG: hypothetical protein AABZ06_12985 [Bdellovibrionota bacterium]